MKVYLGQTRSSKWLRRVCALGFGELTCRPALTPKHLPFALDNGAFSDWKHGRTFEEAAFLNHLELVLLAGFRPDFLVIPDIVAGGLDSLRFSLSWLPRLEVLAPGIPLYLAVQNGMGKEALLPHLGGVSGLFIGGTDLWKRATASYWARFAHEHGLKCHLGRAGTYEKVRLAIESGMDSIDSCLPLRQEAHFQNFLAALQGEPRAGLFRPKARKQLSLWEVFGEELPTQQEPSSTL